MARKSKSEVAAVVAEQVVAEQVVAEQVADTIVDAEVASGKTEYAVAEGTAKFTETPADWDVTKHRTIRRKYFAGKAAWFSHRADVHQRMAEVIRNRAASLRENGDKDRARRRAAKLVAKLEALKAEYGVEIVGNVQG